MRAVSITVVGETENKDDPRVKEIVRKYLRMCNDELRETFPVTRYPRVRP